MDQQYSPRTWSINTMALALASLGALQAVDTASAQEFEWGGETAEVQERIGSATVIFAEGAFVNPRSGRDGARFQWYVVQDSTLGVVFTEPSGIQTTNSGNRFYDGDMDAEALEPIRGVEIRSATFTVWREFTGVISVTSVAARNRGDDFNFDPVWRDFEEPAQTHYISITWVHRVLYDDESIIVADLEPVLQVASRFSDGITRQDLDPETEDRTTTVAAE